MQKAHRNYDHRAAKHRTAEENQPTHHLQSQAKSENDNTSTAKERVVTGIKNVGGGISSFISKHAPKKKQTEDSPTSANDDAIEKIERLAKLKDSGAITQEEYDEKKKELLSKV